MAIYSKYILKGMIHCFGFWHANGKSRKEERNTTSLKIGVSGILRLCLNLYKISKGVPGAENTLERKVKSCQTANIKQSHSRTLFSVLSPEKVYEPF